MWLLCSLVFFCFVPFRSFASIFLAEGLCGSSQRTLVSSGRREQRQRRLRCWLQHERQSGREEPRRSTPPQLDRKGNEKVVEEREAEERDNAVPSQESYTLPQGQADVLFRKSCVTTAGPLPARLVAAVLNTYLVNFSST